MSGMAQLKWALEDAKIFKKFEQSLKFPCHQIRLKTNHREGVLGKNSSIGKINCQQKTSMEGQTFAINRGTSTPARKQLIPKRFVIIAELVVIALCPNYLGQNEFHPDNDQCHCLLTILIITASLGENDDVLAKWTDLMRYSPVLSIEPSRGL